MAVPEEECRDVLFATTDGSLWGSLVERQGWSNERYATLARPPLAGHAVDPSEHTGT